MVWRKEAGALTSVIPAICLLLIQRDRHGLTRNEIQLYYYLPNFTRSSILRCVLYCSCYFNVKHSLLELFFGVALVQCRCSWFDVFCWLILYQQMTTRPLVFPLVVTLTGSFCYTCLLVVTCHSSCSCLICLVTFCWQDVVVLWFCSLPGTLFWIQDSVEATIVLLIRWKFITVFTFGGSCCYVRSPSSCDKLVPCARSIKFLLCCPS
jgi:hypothetical protein